LNATGTQPRRNNFLERYKITGGHLGYLKRLLDWADTHQVSVVIVDMPVSPDLDKRLYPYAFARYRAILAELERTRKLSVLWATSEAAGLDDEHFADHVHLNAAGATRFSSWLRQALTRVEQASR
jgi:lysophospholipase L1-like esterase